MGTLNKQYLDGLVKESVREIARRPYSFDTGWGLTRRVKKPKHIYVLGKNPQNVDYVRRGLLNRLFLMGMNGIDIVGGGLEDIDGDYVISTD